MIYIDVGWTGSVSDITNALLTYGYQANTNGIVTLIDPTLKGDIVAITGYKILDNAAYVLIRSTADIVMPNGIIKLGPDLTSTISGVFMSDPNTMPTVISSSSFFSRFTPSETEKVWKLCINAPAIGVGLMQGLAAGQVDLTDTISLKPWMDALVSSNCITSTRQTVILTP